MLKNSNKKMETKIYITMYSSNKFALIGNTKRYIDEIEYLGGVWCSSLKNEYTGEKFRGWVFENNPLLRSIVEKWVIMTNNYQFILTSMERNTEQNIIKDKATNRYMMNTINETNDENDKNDEIPDPISVLIRNFM